jgi:Sulfotransferase family
VANDGAAIAGTRLRLMASEHSAGEGDQSEAQYRFLDVTGTGNSGKAAAVDLLREFEGVYAPEWWFEFDFIRAPNGLLDLRHRLVHDWSPVRGHYAIRAFLDLTEKMGRDPKWWDVPGLMRSTSQRYDKRFNGQFRALTTAFAHSFVGTQFLAEWPFDYLSEGDVSRFVRKIIRRAGFRSWLRRPVLVPDSHNFDAKARRYLNALFSQFVPLKTRVVILNNGFEPFNPAPALDMIGDARQIVVIRDPRDIYVSGLNRHNVRKKDQGLVAFDNDGLNKSFLATDDLATFTQRLRAFYDHLPSFPDARVLRLRFEDIALDYERTVARICAFLDLDRSHHVNPRGHFQPEKSAANVGLWRKYSRQQDIDFIECRLPEFLFDG